MAKRRIHPGVQGKAGHRGFNGSCLQLEIGILENAGRAFSRSRVRNLPSVKLRSFAKKKYQAKIAVPRWRTIFKRNSRKMLGPGWEDQLATKNDGDGQGQCELLEVNRSSVLRAENPPKKRYCVKNILNPGWIFGTRNTAGWVRASC